MGVFAYLCVFFFFFFFFEQVYLCVDLSVWMCLCVDVFVCGCVCVHLRKKEKMRTGEVTEFVEHGEERKKRANRKLIK